MGTSVRFPVSVLMILPNRRSELSLLGWSKKAGGRLMRTVARSPFGRVTSRFSSADFAISVLTSREPTSERRAGDRIPHVLVGGRSFHDREEIIAIRNALTAIEWPDDELKVFATLRGPFFAIGDEALLVFRQQWLTTATSKPAASIRCTRPIARRLLLQRPRSLKRSRS